MAVGSDLECAGCPLNVEGPPGRGGRKICLRDDAVYPLTLADNTVSVDIRGEAELPEKFSEFTSKIFEVLGRPGTKVHPRAFLRGAVDGKGGRRICPLSWPIPPEVRLVIEQISLDTSGMQPRFLYNDLPWVLQPAIYCDCYMAVAEARKLADDWLEETKKRSGGEGPHGGSGGRGP